MAQVAFIPSGPHAKLRWLKWLKWLKAGTTTTERDDQTRLGPYVVIPVDSIEIIVVYYSIATPLITSSARINARLADNNSYWFGGNTAAVAFLCPGVVSLTRVIFCPQKINHIFITHHIASPPSRNHPTTICRPTFTIVHLTASSAEY